MRVTTSAWIFIKYKFWCEKHRNPELKAKFGANLCSQQLRKLAPGSPNWGPTAEKTRQICKKNQLLAELHVYKKNCIFLRTLTPQRASSVAHFETLGLVSASCHGSGREKTLKNFLLASHLGAESFTGQNRAPVFHVRPHFSRRRDKLPSVGFFSAQLSADCRPLCCVQVPFENSDFPKEDCFANCAGLLLIVQDCSTELWYI